MRIVGFLMVIGASLWASSGSGVVGFLAAWAMVSAGVMAGAFFGTAIWFPRALRSSLESGGEVLPLQRMIFYATVSSLVGGVVMALLACVVV